jgi:hypothetical protein
VKTPRDRLLEEVAARIHGATYRDMLAALLLAGVETFSPVRSVSSFTRCWW